MKFINFSIVKFSVFLTLGILSAFFIPTSTFLLPFLFFGFLILFVIWIVERKRLQKSIFFGILTYLVFFGIGFVCYQLQLPKFQDEHYSHVLSKGGTSETSLLSLKITEVLKPDRYNHKYLAECISVNKTETTGKILLNIQKDSTSTEYTIDDVLLISEKVISIPKPLNPHQFDYSAYMKKLGVYYQVRSESQAILVFEKGSKTIRGSAESFRNHLIAKLNKSNITDNERSIIQALVLGQRRDIDKELYADYAAAGAVHILAVSGLHVGILFFILKWLFSPLGNLRYGKQLKSIVIIGFLFGFALLAGLSPSVVRAATMFSLFLFAEQLKRPTNSINTLFISYLFLLIINPLWLFHVGFQLSYLAVFFILLIQPKLFRYWYPKNRIIRKVWVIITVSIAAQIGVLPLSLFYFHQFPGLFLLTNIVVLPFLGVLLGFGLLIVLLVSINMLPIWLSEIYNHIVLSLNKFISWVAKQDAFLFQDIHFSEEKVLVSYLFIVATILLWKQHSFHRLMVCLLSICLLIGIFIWDRWEASGNELIVFQKSRNTIIGVKNGDNLLLLKPDTLSETAKNAFPIKGYRTAKQIESYSEQLLPKVFSYNNQNILVLDSLAVYPKTAKIDIILLIQSPRVNLERLIDSLQPKQIIADGNNYKTYVTRWRTTCKQKKLPFYHTGTKGAFILE
ncbi:ComEC/Rec2 family competence protein [Marixanthomonas ophiurae]|uniref:ComEC family competence protein n=1 Tax=Marixanthomonas ophiurae TaxID=387659 RepID=A0A3E1Q9G2_9FLAO|nr:ComEC/Rec2 family competence protein [Marixanthomonas ophiurae]RFN58777.1 ComEC family competence protein [Marixanthomonas ophiurae]